MAQQTSDKMKNIHVKDLKQETGSLHGQLGQTANMWNVAGAQSSLHQRLAFEFDRPSCAEKLMSGLRSSVSSQERNIEDMSVKASTSLDHVTRDSCTNVTIGSEEVKTEILQASGQLKREKDSMVMRKGLISDPGLTSSRMAKKSCLLKEDSTCSATGMAAPFSSSNDTNDSTPAPPMAKQMYSSPQNVIESCSELHAHLRNGKPQADPQARAQLFLRNYPRLTDQELQQYSGDSNSVITPLFEKMLTASDAGRTGRLLLPKKCAEDAPMSTGIDTKNTSTELIPSLRVHPLIPKKGSTSRTSLGSHKRKSITPGSKSKESVQLKLTWEAAQVLLRPPPNGASSVVMIDGHEFEGYENW